MNVIVPVPLPDLFPTSNSYEKIDRAADPHAHTYAPQRNLSELESGSPEALRTYTHQKMSEPKQALAQGSLTEPLQQQHPSNSLDTG